MRWLGTVATSTTLFVLQLVLSTTISDPEPRHKALNNSAALFPQPNPGPSTSSLSTGCFGRGIDPRCLFRATSSRTQTLLDVLSETSWVSLDIPCSISCHQTLGMTCRTWLSLFRLNKEHSELPALCRWHWGSGGTWPSQALPKAKGSKAQVECSGFLGKLQPEMWIWNCPANPGGCSPLSCTIFLLLSAPVSSFHPDFLGPVGSGRYLCWVSSSYFG